MAHNNYLHYTNSHCDNGDLRYYLLPCETIQDKHVWRYSLTEYHQQVTEPIWRCLEEDQCTYVVAKEFLHEIYLMNDLKNPSLSLFAYASACESLGRHCRLELRPWQALPTISDGFHTTISVIHQSLLQP